MADREQPDVDVPALTALLDGKYAEIRELTRKNLAEYAGVLDDAIEMPRDEFRERVLELVRLMAETGATGLGFPTEYGGGGDIGASVAAFETLGFGDLSILVKVGVQFGLFGGAILQLGSKNHHDAYVADLVKADLLGCFAMTETGHGSNVQALGTVAAYDHDAKEFVITTPDDLSRKDYIGNAAAHASMAVVFAQLEIHGESEGVHAFVVPIRDKKGKPLDGVRIEDDGAEDRPQRRRQRPDLVRPRPRTAHEPAQPVRRRDRGRALRLRHREQGPAVLHHARHPDPGPGVRRRCRHHGQQGGAGGGDQVRQPAPAVRLPGDRQGGAAPRLRHAPASAAAAAGQDLCAALHPGEAALRAAQRAVDDRGARPAAARARVAGRRDQGDRHLARQYGRSRSAARPAVAPAT